MLTASYAVASIAILCLIAFGLLYLRYGRGWNDLAQRQAKAFKASQRRKH